MKFSQFLTWQLQAKRMSLQDFADGLQRCGYSVSKATVGHWKNERTNPPMGSVEFRTALARTLQMDVNKIMQMLEYVRLEEDYSSEAMRAAELVESMPTDKRTAALTILEQLASLN